MVQAESRPLPAVNVNYQQERGEISYATDKPQKQEALSTTYAQNRPIAGLRWVWGLILPLRMKARTAGGKQLPAVEREGLGFSRLSDHATCAPLTYTQNESTGIGDLCNTLLYVLFLAVHSSFFPMLKKIKSSALTIWRFPFAVMVGPLCYHYFAHNINWHSAHFPSCIYFFPPVLKK